jgi:hypothetical protein
LSRSLGKARSWGRADADGAAATLAAGAPTELPQYFPVDARAGQRRPLRQLFRHVDCPASSMPSSRKSPLVPTRAKRTRSGPRSLPLPHERDEAAGHVAPRTDPLIEQAYQDIEAGQVDTDLRATPGLDAQNRSRMLRGGRRRAPK